VRPALLSSVLLLAVAACGGEATPEAAAATGAAEAALRVAATPSQPATIRVYTTEGCGCCNGWVEHLRAAGFEVDARNVTDLPSIKAGAGIDASLSSCHTALVDGYVVEGHVPADVIQRLLAERPDIAGVVVPGMPVGSPGMEGGGAKPYQVLALGRDGSTEVYAEIDPS
jgi:hypothetical protein